MAGRSYDLDSLATDDSYAPRRCPKCGKTLASKYSLKRHIESQHRNKRVQKSGKGEENESERDNGNEEQLEESDHIWRQLLKKVLRNWSADSDTEMPKSEDELIDSENLEAVREDLYPEIIRVLDEHGKLINSPMYKKLERTRENLQDIFDDDEQDDDWNEAFRQAYDLRKGLINDFIIENKDILENYKESSEDEDSEGDDEESDGSEAGDNNGISYSPPQFKRPIPFRQ